MNKRLKTALRIIPVVLLSGVLLVAATRPAVATVPGNNALVSVRSDGTQGGSASQYPSISRDGRFVAFSSSSNLVTTDNNGIEDVFVRDTISNTTERVSVSSSGVQANNPSRSPYISADGRYIVFYSSARNLIDGLSLPTTVSHWHVYVHDRQTALTEMIDTSPTGDYGNAQGGNIDGQEISEDGRFVAFESAASNLVDVGGVLGTRVYVKDRVLNTTNLLTRTTTGSPAGGNSPSMSCDGAFVAFSSSHPSLTPGDTNGVRDIFLTQRVGGDYTTNITQAGAMHSGFPKVSCNGNFITLTTAATFDPNDSDSQYDNYVYDRINASFERVNVSSNEDTANSAAVSTDAARVSDDGRHVVFVSSATNLDSLATSGHQQVYMRDRTSGTTELVSKNTTPTAGNDHSNNTPVSRSQPVINPIGTWVTYASRASNLVATDANGTQVDVFRAPTGN